MTLYGNAALLLFYILLLADQYLNGMVDFTGTGLRSADCGLRIGNPCKSFISSEKATIIACSYL
jgi:hypothetical protein